MDLKIGGVLRRHGHDEPSTKVLSVGQRDRGNGRGGGVRECRWLGALVGAGRKRALGSAGRAAQGRGSPHGTAFAGTGAASAGEGDVGSGFVRSEPIMSFEGLRDRGGRVEAELQDHRPIAPEQQITVPTHGDTAAKHPATGLIPTDHRHPRVGEPSKPAGLKRQFAGVGRTE